MRLRPEYCSRFIIGIFFFLFFSYNCQSVRETRRFSKCQFKINRVVQLKAAGVDLLSKKKFSDLKFNEGVRLGKAISNNSMPVLLTVNVDVNNPNKHPAALEGFDYRLFLDGKEVLIGSYNRRTEIPAYTAKSINPSFQFDLLSVVKNTDYKTIVNLIFGMFNEKHEPVKIVLLIKPHIRVLGKKVKYPDYIKLSKAYQ